MIKINSRILYFLLTSSFALTMDPPPPKKTNTLLWLADNRLIAGSLNGCSIRCPLSLSQLQPSIQRPFKLHDQPTHNIILNRDKKKVGLFCQKSFVIYDISTRKKIGSLFIDYNDNYSVIFGPTDEIILYHNGNVTIDNKHLHAPFIEHDASFGITCNHRTKEIIYPSSNNTFTRKSLTNNRMTRHSRIIDEDGKKYLICSVFYNLYGPHIALQTYEKNNKKNQKIFLWNTMTNNITKVTLTYNRKEESSYYHAQFLPYSSLIAVLCTHSGIHFWDFVQQKEIWTKALVNADRIRKCEINDNVFDVNSNVTYYAATIHNSYFVKEIPQKIQEILLTSLKERSIFTCWFLCHHIHDDNLLPKEIIHILMNYIRALYNL